MKGIILLVLLLTLPIAIAEINFPTIVSVRVITDNVTCNVNVTTEENEHYYNCLGNSTNSFTFNHLENATQVNNCDMSYINNLSSKMDSLSGTCNNIVSTCNSISQQYGDANTYYKNYATCNTENELCKRDKADRDTKITELTGVKTNFDTCSTNLNSCNSNLNNLNSIVLPKLQTNASSCNQDLEKSKKGKVIWILVGAAIVGGIAFWRDRSRNPITQKDRETGLAGTARR